MQIKFCANPLCPQHISILYAYYHAGTLQIPAPDGSITEYKRHEYIKPDGGRIFFCDICHEAIATWEMVVNGNRQ